MPDRGPKVENSSAHEYTYVTSNGRWQLPNDTHHELESPAMTPAQLDLMAAYQEATGALLCFDTSQGNPFEAEINAWAAGQETEQEAEQETQL
jgi:hypothetical protein